ncbi:MAG TPA: NAD(P)-dependent oxidoreductase [Tepidisphaeraceae bacterium]|nr:NAD(P)-dependent oxidoreductase [Tepidisphaeraceae bacterium]
MRILFTGASSFTGYWFVKELAAAGYDVTATFRQPALQYTDVRKRRVEGLAGCCRAIHGASFGTPEFLDLLKSSSFDLLCHHAADVTNYKGPDFNAVEALATNTRNITSVLNAFHTAGGRRVVLTGSVFENDEGAGSEDLPAFSPYGLSKALTAQSFRYYARVAGIGLGKFVIPNPFGPFEEPRFTAYLVKNWHAGKTPAVETPAYVRDNIHVALLAKAYVRFVERSPGQGFEKMNPSGYVESQGEFALRFAREMRPRLGLSCDVELKVQTQFTEPRIRINTEPADAIVPGWNERDAWDAVAEYYRGIFAK